MPSTSWDPRSAPCAPSWRGLTPGSSTTPPGASPGHQSHLLDKPEGRPAPAPRTHGPALEPRPRSLLTRRGPAIGAPCQARRTLPHQGAQHRIRIRLQRQPHLLLHRPRHSREPRPRRGSANASTPPLPPHAGPRAGGRRRRRRRGPRRHPPRPKERGAGPGERGRDQEDEGRGLRFASAPGAVAAGPKLGSPGSSSSLHKAFPTASLSRFICVRLPSSQPSSVSGDQCGPL